MQTRKHKIIMLCNISAMKPDDYHSYKSLKNFNFKATCPSKTIKKYDNDI
jgi:hypothetical protein